MAAANKTYKKIGRDTQVFGKWTGYREAAKTWMSVNVLVNIQDNLLSKQIRMLGIATARPKKNTSGRNELVYPHNSAKLSHSEKTLMAWTCREHASWLNSTQEECTTYKIWQREKKDRHRQEDSKETRRQDTWTNIKWCARLNNHWGQQRSFTWTHHCQKAGIRRWRRWRWWWQLYLNRWSRHSQNQSHNQITRGSSHRHNFTLSASASEGNYVHALIQEGKSGHTAPSSCWAIDFPPPSKELRRNRCEILGNILIYWETY